MSETGAIYILDDEESIRNTMRDVLEDEGFEVDLFGTPSEFIEAIEENAPDLVLLDIWLPGANGIEILQDVKKKKGDLPVIMISGHAGIDTAVKAIKLGAADFIEKPIQLNDLLSKVESLLNRGNKMQPSTELPSANTPEEVILHNGNHPGSAVLVDGDQPQRTLKKDVVLNGIGLLSGRNTGIILSPLDVNEGIVFQTLDGEVIRNHITSLEGFVRMDTKVDNKTYTANSTVLSNGSRRVRTVEHLLGVFHMFGITNVLVKTDEEIPNTDGSASDFCRLIREAGLVDQNARSKKIVIKEKIRIGEESPNEKYIVVEPSNHFEIRMRVNYPAPIHEQIYEFDASADSFEQEIAPARSFNTLENINMAQQMGKAGKGMIGSHIIMHEGKVINTELRWKDEFVRHKILDLIGDLYLLGYPVQGRFTANMTSHGYNQALAQKIYASLAVT